MRINLSSRLPAILSGALSDESIVSLFRALEGQEIIAEDLVEMATMLRKVLIPVELEGNPIDTCGTGGSGQKTINTSTLVAFIVAAAGGKVAKHGNRSASGNCGCFDLLETLGARIDLTPERERQIYEELGIVFLFARTHHPALKSVGPARKMYGKPTVFNLLGPLLNPAGVKRQLIGVPDPKKATIIAEALTILGTEKAMIVTGEDGLDEVTLTGKTTIRDVPSGKVRTFSPKDLGVPLAEAAAIEGGDAAMNAAIAMDIAKGGGSEAHRNLVLINAALAFTLTDLVKNEKEGLALAKKTLSSGNVAVLMDTYIHATQYNS